MYSIYVLQYNLGGGGGHIILMNCASELNCIAVHWAFYCPSEVTGQHYSLTYTV